MKFFHWFVLKHTADQSIQSPSICSWPNGCKNVQKCATTHVYVLHETLKPLKPKLIRENMMVKCDSWPVLASFEPVQEIKHQSIIVTFDTVGRVVSHNDEICWMDGFLLEKEIFFLIVWIVDISLVSKNLW